MVKYKVMARKLSGGEIRMLGEVQAHNWKDARKDAMSKYWSDLSGEQMIVASPGQMKKYWKKEA